MQTQRMLRLRCGWPSPKGPPNPSTNLNYFFRTYANAQVRIRQDLDGLVRFGELPKRPKGTDCKSVG